MKQPRTIAREIEQHTRLPSGPAECFSGYAVLGVGFSSGHVLAMRRFPASSVGAGYTSVWHRNPDDEWTMWVDVDPLHACPRYFGSGVEQVVPAAISISWPDERRMVVRIDEGRQLDWDVELGSTLATRFLSAVGKATPDLLWRRRSLLSAVAAVAGPMLRVGRLSLHGTVPNGQWFMANPKSIWIVRTGRAHLQRADLGEVATLAGTVSLGDFLIPQRGVFAVGQGLFEPFAEGRHLAVPSKEAGVAERSSS